MTTLTRASRLSGVTTTASAGFERSRLCLAGVDIGLAPGHDEPTGFAVDLERVLAGVPRRALAVEPRRPGSRARRAQGRWPRTPFHLSNAARIWVRDKGMRR